MGIIDKKQFTAALDYEMQNLFCHIYDLSERSYNKGIGLYGPFLSENEQAELLRRERYLPCGYELFGGFEGAERKMIAFIPEWEEADFPIAAVKLTGRTLSKLNHRDFLGSIMGLGIKREKCGDIIIGDDVCYAIMERDIASFSAGSLIKVGREGVNAELSTLSDISVPERKLKPVTGTVASLRLDAVLTLMCGSGRSAAAEIIKSGRVFVNGLSVLKADLHLSDGDVISVRGKGKATLSVGGTSKKDRIFITLNKYV